LIAYKTICIAIDFIKHTKTDYLTRGLHLPSSMSTYRPSDMVDYDRPTCSLSIIG